MCIYIYILSRASPLLPFKLKIRSPEERIGMSATFAEALLHATLLSDGRVSLLCIGSLGTLAKRPTARSERSRGCFPMSMMLVEFTHSGALNWIC